MSPPNNYNNITLKKIREKLPENLIEPFDSWLNSAKSDNYKSNVSNKKSLTDLKSLYKSDEADLKSLYKLADQSENNDNTDEENILKDFIFHQIKEIKNNKKEFFRQLKDAAPNNEKSIQEDNKAENQMPADNKGLYTNPAEDNAEFQETQPNIDESTKVANNTKILDKNNKEAQKSIEQLKELIKITNNLKESLFDQTQQKAMLNIARKNISFQRKSQYEALKNVLSGLDNIKQPHENFYSLLEKLDNDPKNLQNFSSENKKIVENYVIALTNMQSAMEQWQKVTNKQSTITKNLNKYFTKSGSKVPLDSLLMAPVQKTPRMELLCKDIIKSIDKLENQEAKKSWEQFNTVIHKQLSQANKKPLDENNINFNKPRSSREKIRQVIKALTSFNSKKEASSTLKEEQPNQSQQKITTPETTNPIPTSNEAKENNNSPTRNDAQPKAPSEESTEDKLNNNGNTTKPAQESVNENSTQQEHIYGASGQDDADSVDYIEVEGSHDNSTKEPINQSTAQIKSSPQEENTDARPLPPTPKKQVNEIRNEEEHIYEAPGQDDADSVDYIEVEGSHDNSTKEPTSQPTQSNDETVKKIRGKLPENLIEPFDSWLNSAESDNYELIYAQLNLPTKKSLDKLIDQYDKNEDKDEKDMLKDFISHKIEEIKNNNPKIQGTTWKDVIQHETVQTENTIYPIVANKIKENYLQLSPNEKKYIHQLLIEIPKLKDALQEPTLNDANNIQEINKALTEITNEETTYARFGDNNEFKEIQSAIDQYIGHLPAVVNNTKILDENNKNAQKSIEQLKELIKITNNLKESLFDQTQQKAMLNIARKNISFQRKSQYKALKNVLSGLDNIKQPHEKFYSLLEKLDNDPKNLQNFSSENKETIENYVISLTNMQSAMEQWQKVTNKQSTITKNLNKYFTKSGSKVPLDSLLMAPVQKTPRMELLCKDIIKSIDKLENQEAKKSWEQFNTVIHKQLSQANKKPLDTNSRNLNKSISSREKIRQVIKILKEKNLVNSKKETSATLKEEQPNQSQQKITTPETTNLIPTSNEAKENNNSPTRNDAQPKAPSEENTEDNQLNNNEDTTKPAQEPANENSTQQEHIYGAPGQDDDFVHIKPKESHDNSTKESTNQSTAQIESSPRKAAPTQLNNDIENTKNNLSHPSKPPSHLNKTASPAMFSVVTPSPTPNQENKKQSTNQPSTKNGLLFTHQRPTTSNNQLTESFPLNNPHAKDEPSKHLYQPVEKTHHAKAKTEALHTVAHAKQNLENVYNNFKQMANQDHNPHHISNLSELNFNSKSFVVTLDPAENQNKPINLTVQEEGEYLCYLVPAKHLAELEQQDIQQICTLAVQSAEAGTEFNLANTPENLREQVGNALNEAIDQRQAQEPDFRATVTLPSNAPRPG
jgi:hypothetical protein